jgi:sulfotransferase family protein
MDLTASRTTGIPAQKIETPIFLIGSERSGTTLLRLMLDHHPQIAFNLESEFLVSEISGTGAFPEMTGYLDRLRQNRVFRHSRFVIRGDLDYPALVNDFLQQKLQRDRKSVAGATVHYGFSKLQYIWPAAKYIYMLRDGRDVASSVVEMGWAGNVFVGANWWLEAEREWAAYRRSLPPDRWIEVRYEELIADTGAQLARICDFVGVSFSQRMFDYAKTSSYSLPDSSQACKWRRKMPAGDIRLLEARLGPQLAARGYELTSATPRRIAPARAAWLRLHSRLKVLRRRVVAFGLWLFTVELVSRRLGWTVVNGRAQHAIDALIDQNLK